MTRHHLSNTYDGRYWPEWAPVQPVDAWTREGELNAQKDALKSEIAAVQAHIDAATGAVAYTAVDGGGGGGKGDA